MRIPESTVDEVLARTDLAELLESYGVQVKGAGNQRKACCPFHHEKTPSFSIDVAKGLYHCFGCGESGSSITFVQKTEGLTFLEAVRKLADRCGVKVEEKEDPEAGRRQRLYALMAELAQFYHRCLLKMKDAEIARAYLKSRNLDESVQESFLIGYAPVGVSPILKWAEKYGYTADELAAAGVIKPPRDTNDRGYHRFGGRLMFSVRDRQGRVVAFSGRQLVEDKHSGKYVNSPETAIFKKSKVLFGFDKAAANIAKNPHHEAIVCEGQIDTIRLHISGFPVAVASQGTAFTEEHMRMLKRVADQVALVFDDDAAGHKATVRTARLALAAEMPVRVVSLPGGDDPDSYLRKHSQADFQQLLDSAESILSFQVRAERAKESQPDTIDAVARVTRAILETVAAADNAVIRASMLGEAAKLLGLPVTALNEELQKVKVERRPAMTVPDADGGAEDDAETAAPADDGEVSVPGENAAALVPPPPRELAFCAFLLANEYDQSLASIVGESLPTTVFSHRLSADFVATWLAEVECGTDLMRAFADKLDASARDWFDRILLEAGKAQASELDAKTILVDFVCALWCEALRRERGNLPANGGPEADLLRMKLSLRIKQLPSVGWTQAKEMIRELIAERQK